MENWDLNFPSKHLAGCSYSWVYLGVGWCTLRSSYQAPSPWSLFCLCQQWLLSQEWLWRCQLGENFGQPCTTRGHRPSSLISHTANGAGVKDVVCIPPLENIPYLKMYLLFFSTEKTPTFCHKKLELHWQAGLCMHPNRHSSKLGPFVALLDSDMPKLMHNLLLLVFVFFFILRFGLGVPVILRNSEETESSTRVLKKRMRQVKNPFGLAISHPDTASVTSQ